MFEKIIPNMLKIFLMFFDDISHIINISTINLLKLYETQHYRINITVKIKNSTLFI
jgi:hypothetical protein